MSTIYKWFSVTIVVVFLLFSWWFAQEGSNDYCDAISLDLLWPSIVIWGQDYRYELSVHLASSANLDGLQEDAVISPQEILSQMIVQYELLYWWRVLQRSSTSSFDVSINQLGSYMIRTLVQYNSCSYLLENTVTAYDAIFAYIWPYIDEFGIGIIQNMSQNNLFLRPFVVGDDLAAIVPLLRSHWSVLVQAQDIYFSLNNYAIIFDILRLLDQDPSIDISEKRIFVIDDMDKVIVKKFLTRFARSFDNVSVYVISSSEAMSMFLSLSIGKTDYISEDIEQSLLYLSPSGWTYSFSYILDYLLFQWFPLDMLLWMLSCIFAVLFIVFCKQMIGVSSYGVYYPILFAIAGHVVWLYTSLFLLIMAIFAKIVLILFTRNFTLLVTAKIWLYLSFYVFFTIFGLMVLSALGFIQGDFVVFNQPMMIFIYIAIPLIATKLWTSNSLHSIKKQFGSLLVFVLLSAISYSIIQSTFLHHIILQYPALLFIAIVCIVFIGRYTGLQLLELVRFWPLIAHLRKKK